MHKRRALLPHAAVDCVRFFFKHCLWLFVFFCLCMKYLGNCWTDLREIHREDVFGPLLGRVWMSRSKIKVIRNKKHAVHSHYPQQRRNGTSWLQTTSCSSRWHHSVAAGGVISVACMRFMFGKTSLALVLICFYFACLSLCASSL